MIAGAGPPVRADEKGNAFLELETADCTCARTREVVQPLALIGRHLTTVTFEVST